MSGRVYHFRYRLKAFIKDYTNTGILNRLTDVGDMLKRGDLIELPYFVYNLSVLIGYINHKE